jgi:uncharacterized GH25 family protein
MKKLVCLFSVASSMLFLSACSKAGKGGDASIQGKVLHHETIIPNARVFVKYDKTEFPGADTTKYDDVVNADNQGNYVFSGLKKGKYYLYGVGKDGVANGNPFDVFGGSRIDINSKTAVVQFNVPVTED